VSSEELAREFMGSAADDRLTLAQVASLMGVSLPRVFAWVGRGVGGVRLPSIAIGGGARRCGKRLVLRQWLARFLSATNEPTDAANRVAA
jgi:hypothetical protein